MYLSNRNWHEGSTELKLNPHPYLIVFATQYLCYTIIINEVTFTKCRNAIICFYWLLVLHARYQHEVRQAKPKGWAKRVPNGDSDPRAKLKPEPLTRGRLFVGRGLPVLRQQMKGLAQAYCQERIVTNSPLFISLKKDISCRCKCKYIYHFVILDFPTWSNICEKPKYCCKHRKTTIHVFPVGTRRGSFALFAYIFNMLNNLKNVTLFEKFFLEFFSLSFSFHIICWIFLRKIWKRKTFLFFFFLSAVGSTTIILPAKDLSPGYWKPSVHSDTTVSVQPVSTSPPYLPRNFSLRDLKSA